MSYCPTLCMTYTIIFKRSVVTEEENMKSDLRVAFASNTPRTINLD